ncbi:hypothetical protein PHYPSEUDO_013236 [Phytophthora pseudosyringae]|uniref:Uncharacterized protein n=1 Tax=Phytophthora pseudosyringae TaxID=221518 RepID=A0A8T1W700_9STRA|nr:hypothetical protein PHYPSEUDO_013236 [Phytophthora pseudosyringae]
MLKGTVFPLICIAMMRWSVMHRESRKNVHDKVVRRLQLITKDGERFFEAIHASPNRLLFRDNFRMDSEAFGDLFERCQYHIDKSERSARGARRRPQQDRNSSSMPGSRGSV